MAIKLGSNSLSQADYSSANLAFKAGVNIIFPGKKTVNLNVRILPAFDENMSFADPGRALSWIPYRTDEIDAKSGREKLSGWFVMLKTYRYWGRLEQTFFSPSVLDLDDTAKPEDILDPIHMCREIARKSQDPRWKALTEKPVGTDNQMDKAILCAPSAQAYINAVTWQNAPTGAILAETVQNSIVALSHTGFEYLIEQLDWMMTVEAQQDPNNVDPRWPTYLLGDVTSPDRGRRGWLTQQEAKGNARNAAWTIKFTAADQKLQGSALMPLAGEAAMKFLAGRYILNDSANVLNILKPQEIVQLMINDGAIPRDLIQHACSHIADISGVVGPTFASAVHVTAQSPASPFGAPAMPAPTQQAASPFGAPAMPMPAQQAASPFGAPAMPTQQTASPFGAPAQQTPFTAPGVPMGAPGQPMTSVPSQAFQAAPSGVPGMFGSAAPVASTPFAPQPGGDAAFGAPPVMQQFIQALPTMPPAALGAPPAPPAPPAAPPAPAPVEGLDWFIWQNEQPVAMTRSQVLAVAAQNPQIPVCPKGSTSWGTVTSCNVAGTAAPAAPTAAMAIPQTTVQHTGEALAPLSEIEFAEFRQLKEATKTSELPISQHKRMLDLTKRAAANGQIQ